jgi:integrase
MSANGFPTECKTVHDVISLYLPQARRELGDHAYGDRARRLLLFDADLGDVLMTEFKPFHLTKWLNDHPSFASPWTVQAAIVAVKRAFNWALDNELITRNPVARMKKPKAQRRRPMTDDEYQTLLRGADPQFRRLVVMLAFSGCRPIEASTTKWADVRFEEKCILLRAHKSATKTGKPRLIPLVPTTIKLLLWIRRHRQITTIQLVESVLRKGPVKAWELAGQMKQYGVSYHAVQRARITMGVIRKRVRPGSPDWTGADLTPRQQTDLRIVEAWEKVRASKRCRGLCPLCPEDDKQKVRFRGLCRRCYLRTHRRILRGKTNWEALEKAGTAAPLVTDYTKVADDMYLSEKEVAEAIERHRRRRDSYLVYLLPPDYRSPVDPHASEFVFLNFKHNPWVRSAIGCAMRRIRRRTGLPKDAQLYGLRHRYGTRGVKHNVNLKLLSLCMGHADTRITEHYIHEAGLTENVQQAALEVAYGARAIGISLPVPVQKIVIVPEPPPVEAIQADTQHLPSRHRMARDRPHVEMNGANGNGESKTEYLLQLLLKRVGGAIPNGVKPSQLNGEKVPLKPAQERAYLAWKAALEESPELAKLKDRQVFDWMLARPEYAVQIPSHFETAYRYIAAGRKFYGCVKRPRKG